MNREALILSLKEKLKVFSPEREGFVFRSGEAPIGALSQVTGSLRTSWVADRIAREGQENDFAVAWIEKERSVFPTALAQRGVDLESVLFIETGGALSDWEWATLQAFDSQLFRLVVLNTEVVESTAMLRVLKRFQIAAERAHAAAVFLVEQKTSAWPIRFHYSTDSMGENRDERHFRVV